MTTGIIDFHTHLDDRWLEHPLMDRAAFLEGMDSTGVERACIFTMMGFYADQRAAHDRLLEHAAASPRLIPFITVDPKLGNDAVVEARRCMQTGLFRGMKFHPWIQAFAAAMVQPIMDQLLRLAAEHGTPVLFHDGTPPYSTTFQIAAQARRVPEAVVVLGHGGLADYTEAAAQLAAEIPNLYVCSCGPKAADLRFLTNMVGSEKVLFGSDYGITNWRILAERLDDLMFAGLSEKVLQAILHDNAYRLLRLNTTAHLCL